MSSLAHMNGNACALTLRHHTAPTACIVLSQVHSSINRQFYFYLFLKKEEALP